MRRTLFIVLPALFLGSCLPSGARPAPADILALSTVASQQLLSARFDGEIQFRADEIVLGGISEGEIKMSGVMQDAGKQLDMKLNIDSSQTDGSNKMNAEVSVIVAGQDQTFVRIDALQGGPSGLSVPLLQEWTGKWWKMPASGFGTSTSTVTTDPQFLQLQSDSVIVTDDNGYETIGGRTAHHYDVVADKQKLAAFLSHVAAGRGQEISEEAALATIEHLEMTGELWIDAQTYVLRRVEWSIVSQKQDSPMELIFSLTLTDHNAQVNIQPPAEIHDFPFEPSFVPSVLQSGSEHSAS